MSKRASYVPRHRNVPDHSALLTGAKATVAYSGVAAIATGVSVAGGVLSTQSAVAGSAVAPTASIGHAASSAGADDSRTRSVSRSADRQAQVVSAKQDVLSTDGGVARTKVEKINPSDVKALARALMPEFGLETSEFGCLDRIWTQESGWRVNADNPTSSAYGIPQALPGSKMSSAGPDWEHNAETQIRWGLGYIRDRYGSACGAAGFKSGHGWY